jgi:hypothetical protein
MTFFTDKTQYTHKGSFYFIPVYLNLKNPKEPIVEGTNILFDKLFDIMAYFHNTVIEFGAQSWAAATGRLYEAGFPFIIKGELNHEEK